MREFQGRVVVPGACKAEALVSHGGFNTLASYQMALTIGSTTGGMVLFTVCSYGKQPACMLFSKPIDSLAASGAILADVWTDAKMPVVDNLGEDFLAYVKDGMEIRVSESGLVTVD